MSKGVVLIANNNGRIDYVKQAVFLSQRVNHFLDLPVCIITDSPDYLKNNFDLSTVDKIVDIPYKTTDNKRFYFDGSTTHKTLQFKNQSRALAYFSSPYDNTLVMDTDFIVSNSLLKQCFTSHADLMLYKTAHDLSGFRDMSEFEFISDKSVDFYWATVIYFKKNRKNDVFFDLVNHIEEYWYHYRKVYQINNSMFRNDFAFSIAVHIMNGFYPEGDIVDLLPGKHYYTIDKDILQKINNDYMLFLIEKQGTLGDYIPISTKGLNVHVMNKFSLERCINE